MSDNDQIVAWLRKSSGLNADLGNAYKASRGDADLSRFASRALDMAAVLEAMADAIERRVYLTPAAKAMEARSAETACGLGPKGDSAAREAGLPEADALLAAAAHDMLSVLEPIVRILGHAEWAGPEGAEEILERLINCHWADGEAAIAKATGGAS